MQRDGVGQGLNQTAVGGDHQHGHATIEGRDYSKKRRKEAHLRVERQRQLGFSKYRLKLGDQLRCEKLLSTLIVFYNHRPQHWIEGKGEDINT